MTLQWLYRYRATKTCHWSTPIPIFQKGNFKIVIPNHYVICSCQFGYDMTVMSLLFYRLTHYFNPCRTHKACSYISRSLSYRRRLSILVRPTGTCFLEVIYPKNFLTYIQVIIPIPSGTNNLSALSGHSMVIDLSFLIQFLEIPNLYSKQVVF